MTVEEFWKRVNTSDVSEYLGCQSVGPDDERESQAFIVELRHKRWILAQKSNSLSIRTRVTRALEDNVHVLDGPDVKPKCEPESRMTVRSRTHMHRIFESAGLKMLLERRITANYLSVSVCCPVWFFVLK